MKSLYLFGLMLVLPLQILFAQNHQPVAVEDTADAYAQLPVIIDVLANDYDVDSDSIILLDVRTFGDDSAFIEDQKIHFIPYFYAGEHSFKYIITDEHNLSNQAWVSVNVFTQPDAPVAVVDTFRLIALKSYNLNILENDFDPNGDMFKINKISDIYNCKVTINSDSLSVNVVADNDVQYGYFTYQIKEIGSEEYLSQKIVDRVRVIENEDIPIAKHDSANAIGGLPVYIGVLENDFDPQGEEIELNYFWPSENSTVSKLGDSILYTPNLSFCGTDFFHYSIREKQDTAIYSKYTSVKVNVSKNLHCPVAVDDYITGTAGVPITINVLENDYDFDSDTIRIKVVSDGTITEDNKILYESFPYETGLNTFKYRVEESGNDLSFSEWATVSINLVQNPSFPETIDDYATTKAGKQVTIKPLENDLVNSFDSLKILTAIPYDKRMGTISIDDETVTYYPAFQAEGTQTLKYLVKKNNITVATGKIHINILKQQYSDSLQVNAINAGVNAGGYLFADRLELEDTAPYQNNFSTVPHFKYPKETQNNLILCSGFWIGGYDSNGLLHISSDRYREYGRDWHSGPISNEYDTAYFEKYARVWKISRQEIEYHRNHYTEQGYSAIEAIGNWPGNGNPSLGQSLQLAPYFDKNGDGFYNCMDGDYPLIRGDQTIFFIYNDDFPHTDSDGLPLKTEIHAMVYGYNAPQDTALFNTVFVHYDLINRSNEVYTQCLTGIFSAADYQHDENFDYLGCDVARGSFYVYSGKKIDGENPPATGVTVLAGPYLDPDGVDNPSGGCNESVNGINFGNQIVDDERSGLSRFNNLRIFDWSGSIEYPDLTPNQIYGYMNGIWSDTTAIEYGENGHHLFGSVGPACRFMYPGDSDPLNWGTDCQFPNGGYNQGTKFWTEEQSWNTYGERRGLGSMSPFTFSPGQVQEVDLAFVVGQGDNGPSSSVNQLLRNIDSLRSKVALGEVVIPNSSLGSKDATELQTVTVYPNPTKDIILISGLNSKGGEYTITNLYGKTMMQGRILSSTRQEINVAKLPAGIYFIRINSGSSVNSGKFIKIN